MRGDADVPLASTTGSPTSSDADGATLREKLARIELGSRARPPKASASPRPKLGANPDSPDDRRAGQPSRPSATREGPRRAAPEENLVDVAKRVPRASRKRTRSFEADEQQRFVVTGAASCGASSVCSTAADVTIVRPPAGRRTPRAQA